MEPLQRSGSTSLRGDLKQALAAAYADEVLVHLAGVVQFLVRGTRQQTWPTRVRAVCELNLLDLFCINWKANLFFITINVMVDIVFACFIFCTFYWR